MPKTCSYCGLKLTPMMIALRRYKVVGSNIACIACFVRQVRAERKAGESIAR